MSVSVTKSGGSIAPKSLSFGERSSYIDENSYEKKKLSAKVAKIQFIALSCIFIPVAVGSIFFSAVPILFVLVSITVLVSSFFIMISMKYQSLKAYQSRNIFDQIPDDKKIQHLKNPRKQKNVRNWGKVINNSKKAYEWKKKLIESAQHNIVLSANLCNKKIFHEILDLFEKKLEENKEIQIVFISASMFVKKDIALRLTSISEKYPRNFVFVGTESISHLTPTKKFSMNHAKALTIDYGKYMIIGGSTLQEHFCNNTGLEYLSDQKFCILGRSFRDMDFIFYSPQKNDQGEKTHNDLLRLAYRWRYLLRKDTSDEEAGNILRLMKRPKGLSILTKLKDFHGHNILDEKPMKVSFKTITIGPEISDNPFRKEILTKINNAKDRIVIDHMYFHPTDDIMNAIKNAAKRNVKITIVTNGYKKYSPKAHKLFGNRNYTNIRFLIQDLPQEILSNITCYEFYKPMTTMHKKVIVVDDTVISGSSNLGDKSLIYTADHEINFTAESKEFADKTIEVINEDIHHSSLIKSDGSVGFLTTFYARRHKRLGYYIG